MSLLTASARSAGAVAARMSRTDATISGSATRSSILISSRGLKAANQS